MIEKNLSGRIEKYWDSRSENFSKKRKLELNGENYFAWQKIFMEHLPNNKNLKILDVGTGAGFFAIILSKLGHKVIGADMSAKMIAEAEKNSADFNCTAKFIKMDAQKLDFSDEIFDVVVSRNLTWTLPDVIEAYREWRRVLKVGGLLMNFDSDLGGVTFKKSSDAKDIHSDVDEKLIAECNEIKSELRISTHNRPTFDVEFLRRINFSVDCVEDISEKIHCDKNILYDNLPTFAIFAKKL